MDHLDQETLYQPVSHDQVSRTEGIGLGDNGNAQPRQSSFNSWFDFATAQLSQFPQLAYNEHPWGDWVINSYNPPPDSTDAFEEPEMNPNCAHQPNQKDGIPTIPNLHLASMVKSFLAAESMPQSEPLNLHPIPIESVQTFVVPSEPHLYNGNQANVDNAAEAMGASSSATVVVHHGDGSKEMVVDLTLTAKARLLSQTKGPRRNGPLSDESRAAIKLLKEIGACWHCRFTKAQCDIQDPCNRCPTTRATPWRVVGCKRGTLRDALIPVVLCPKSDAEAISSDITPSESGTQCSTATARGANTYLCEITSHRKKLLQSSKSDSSLTGMKIDPGDPSSIYQKVFARFSKFGYKSPPHFLTSTKDTSEETSLYHRVVEILWETQQNPELRNNNLSRTVDTQPDLEDLICSAALYQTKEVGYQLIDKALLCLQSSLEAVRVQASGKLTRASHQNCNASSCNIDCLSKLDDNLEVYMDLLSKAIFKPNSKNCREWWLSVFYSLCIQSYVRRLLVLLVCHLDGDEAEERKTINSSADEYLHLAIELFAACNNSGRKYDPLNYNLAKLSSAEDNLARKHGLDFDHAALAQVAAHQDLWLAKGISGSYEYLRKQFDLGGGMAESSNLRKRRRSDSTDHSNAHSCTTAQSECSFQRRQKRAHIRANSANPDADNSDIISLLQNQIEDPPPPKVLDDVDDLHIVRASELRFEDDRYTPRWLRSFKREGWCGLCKPGRWIDTGTAWWNHRVLFHGICAETGKTFPDPESAEEVNAVTRTWKGRCGKCKAWITFRLGDKRHYSGWYMHAANCYDKSFILNSTATIVVVSEASNG